MSRKTDGTSRLRAKHHHARMIAVRHVRSVPIPDEDFEHAAEAERPFEEGAHDVIDPDLRHRMISEAAYALYAQRGYVDGFDVDDWLTAEAGVDHILLDRGAG
jgi:hypothetical protein